MRLSLSYHLFDVAAFRPACSFGRQLQHPVDALRFLTSRLAYFRRTFEQLGSPAGFRGLSALAFREFSQAPGIYRSPRSRSSNTSKSSLSSSRVLLSLNNSNGGARPKTSPRAYKRSPALTNSTWYKGMLHSQMAGTADNNGAFDFVISRMMSRCTKLGDWRAVARRGSLFF